MLNWFSITHCVQCKHFGTITCLCNGTCSLPSTGSSTWEMPDEWGLLGRHPMNEGYWTLSFWPSATIRYTQG